MRASAHEWLLQGSWHIFITNLYKTVTRRLLSRNGGILKHDRAEPYFTHEENSPHVVSMQFQEFEIHILQVIKSTSKYDECIFFSEFTLTL